MKFEKIETKLGRVRTKFPNSTRITIRKSKNSFALSVPSHTHGWDFFVKADVIKILANHEQKSNRTFLIVPKDVLLKASFNMKKDGKGYLAYRFMPDKDTIYVTQKKAILNRLIK